MTSGSAAHPGYPAPREPSDGDVGAPVEATSAAPLPPLPVARLEFTAALERPLELPAHPGALLRSVFGAALRQGTCTTGVPRCGECPLLRSCAYPAIFETPTAPTQFEQKFSQLPNPYVIEPPAGPVFLRAGEPLVFHMVLSGSATQRQTPLIISAWQRALRLGLGQARITGHLQAVAAVDAFGQRVPMFPPASGADAAPVPLLDLAALIRTGNSEPAALELHFESPLRLQHESKPLRPDQLTPRTFMSHLLRRITLMLDVHMGIRPAPFDARALLSLADQLAHDGRQLQWHDLRRYSARQGQELPQGGVQGAWLWRGPMAPLLPWLLMGQWLHVGKGATAGLGGYTVRAVTP
jgi:hypothetical protein